MTHIKVLHVYRTYFPDPPGGLQEAIRQIALSTNHYGIENRIFTLSPTPTPPDLERPEGRVIRARSYIAPSSCDIGIHDAFHKFSKLIQWADIIHYHFPWPFADLLHFSTRVQKPAVMTYHSDVINKGLLGTVYGPLMHKMISSMDAIIATSEAYANSSPVLKNRVPDSHLSIIPLGINENSYSTFTKDARHINLHERFGLNEDGYFLFVGVLRRYKGLYNLAKAAAKTKLPVVIAGSGSEHDLLSPLAKECDNIRLVGQVSDAEKMALIQGCRAAILPSNYRSEAFGVFLIEAAMCGKPMISCEIGTGTSYINKHQMTGLVVPPDNIAALVQAMMSLTDHDTTVAEFGRAARTRYNELFSGEAQGRAYTNLYHSVKRAE